MASLSRYRSFIVVGSLYLLIMQLGFLVLALPGSLAGNADYRSFYSAGRMVRDGQGAQLYNGDLAHAAELHYVGSTGPILPFIHPSYEAGLFALLSFFSYKVSFCLFFILNIILLAANFCLFLPVCPWIRDTWKFLPVMATAVFLPVGVCLIHGQDSILLLTIVAATYALERRGKEFTAGLVLGLGMFRFQMLLPVALVLLFARRWRFMYGFAVSTAAMIGACVLVSGPSVFEAYTRALLSISSGLETGAQKIALSVWPETMPNLRGIFYFLLAHRVPHLALQGITLLVSAALLLWAAVKRLPIELAVIVAILVSYHGGLHDSVLLFLPMFKARVNSDRSFKLYAIIWLALLSGATLATVFRVPHSLLGLIYLAFLAVLVKSSKGDPELVRGALMTEQVQPATAG